jgi:hypothetical protein
MGPLKPKGFFAASLTALLKFPRRRGGFLPLYARGTPMTHMATIDTHGINDCNAKQRSGR